MTAESHIHVCPLSRLEATVTAIGANRLVTLLHKDTVFARPAVIAADAHLALFMHDIAEPLEGMVPPGRDHIERLLAFGESWDRATPLLVHCFAGISRSTAAAYILASAMMPARDEEELALELRRLSPSATPNPLMISHADAILGRGGRMVRAIASIGRGAEAFEGEPFALTITR